jgi:DNA polymerase III subunit epsilon
MKLYTILDFETTGLNINKGEDQVTQVAAIKFNEEGNEVGRFVSYIQLWNKKPISPYTPKITVELCNTGLRESQMFDLLYEFSGDSIVVAQNAPFDLSFLDWSPEKFICTRALTYLVEPKENPSLKPTCERHGINLDNHHDPVCDVLATKEILFKMKKIAEEKGIWYENTVVDFSYRPLTFIPRYARVIKEQQ